MSEFIELSEIYLPVAGGAIAGSLDIGGSLTVNSALGDGSDYNVAEKITELEETINKMTTAFTTIYTLDCAVTLGDNYSSGSASAYLLGNSLRMYMTATRSSAASAGDITNETVMTITVTDRGKIKTVYGASFGPSTSGGPANFHCGVTQGDTTTTLTVTLAGVAISDNAWNAYWTLPVTLNFDAF